MILATALSAGVGAAVMFWMRSVEPAPVAAPIAAAVEPARTIPDVARVLRALKLVTVEIETGVSSSSADESWRGDVLATVVAPVKFYYGVDMGGLEKGDVWKNPLTGAWTVRVPRPRRLAVEVFGRDEQTKVRVAGLRLRDVAGEYYLGLARTGLYQRAREMTLTDEDRARLEQMTREQLTDLVRTLLGEETTVQVEFAPEVPEITGSEGERP